DPQANSTQVFIHPSIEIDVDKSLYSVLVKFAPIESIVRKTSLNNLSLAPSDLRLSGVDLELANAFDNRSARLQRALDVVRNKYDYVIIDNPPSLGLLTVNTFAASDHLIIPVSTAFFALTGLVQLQETIEMVRAQLNPSIEI